MGNCSSSPKTDVVVKTKAANSSPPKKTRVTSNNNKTDDSSTAALISAIVPIVIPLVRKVASQQLINEKMVLKDEKLVEKLDKKNLPLGPITFRLGDINVLSSETLIKDMTSMPEFSWPEKERLSELMEFVPGIGCGMVALDMADVEIRLEFGDGIELSLPVDGPLGLKCNLEVGSGGSIDVAWFQLQVPKVRLWFVVETQKLYVAFLGRPEVLPNIHVNADRGKGDFIDMEFTEHGTSLDDVVERVLIGFGPRSLMKDEDEDDKKKKVERSWVGDALGRAISNAVGTFAGVGNNRPLEVELQEAIESSLDIAMGKPRPIDEIKADMKILEAELKAAQEEVANEEEDAGLTPKWCGVGL